METATGDLLVVMAMTATITGNTAANRDGPVVFRGSPPARRVAHAAKLHAVTLIWI